MDTTAGSAATSKTDLQAALEFAVVFDLEGKPVAAPPALWDATQGSACSLAVQPVSNWVTCLERGEPVGAGLEVGPPTESTLHPCLLVPLCDASGRRSGVAAVPFAWTHQAMSVAEARHRALWQKAATTTHDLANQLFILSGNLELLEIVAAGKPEFLDLLTRVGPALERARSLAREAHDLTRQGRSGL
jgi:hypothetical protein